MFLSSYKQLWFSCCLGAFVLWSGLAQAGIVITGTRVIYPAEEREVTIKMTNTAKEPSLVQAWVDKGNAQLRPDQADGPFLITPPITRVEPGKGQALRLVYTGDEAASKQQESLFWLNVLDVPPMPKGEGANFLQVAVRSRLKIFLRPKGLPGTPAEAAKSLNWSLQRSGQGFVLRSNNSSAFHVSLATLKLQSGGRTFSVRPEDLQLIKPGSSQDFVLQGTPAAASADAQVIYQWVSDFGAIAQQEASLTAH